MSTKNKLHIVTAFSRVHLFNELCGMLSPFRVDWTIVCDNETADKVMELNPPEWVNIVINHHEEGWDRCYEKLNRFIATQRIEQDDYYMILNDDDAIEDNLIPELMKMNADIIVVSMKRGDKIPEGHAPHGTSTLIADPNNMKVGFIGPEQIVYKGKVFKTIKFNNTYCGDGEMAERIHKDYRSQIVYRPDLFVLFNYYQPGRYNK